MKHTTIAAPLALAGLLLATHGTAWANDLGRCYSADVEFTVVLPDGVERPPGHIRVCAFARPTPVTTIHKLYWNGELVGMYEARSDEQDARSLGVEGTVLAFTRRRGANRHVFVGYATVQGRHGYTYALGLRGRVTSDWWVAHDQAPVSDSSEWVLVAARYR